MALAPLEVGRETAAGVTALAPCPVLPGGVLGVSEGQGSGI